MAKQATTPPTKMTVDDAWGRFERGEPLVFLDVRNPRAWEESDAKLPGAIRVTAGEIDRHVDELPRDRPIVPYCT